MQMSRSSSTTAASLPSSLPRDIRDFLLHYPSRSPSPSSSANLTFYQNTSPARPSPLTIDALHASLKHDYSELEHSHSFIQWFFPIKEMGMNWQSQPLEDHEITGIKADGTAMRRLRESYEIMLDFYGFNLVDFGTGRIERKSSPLPPAPGSDVVRYRNLSTSSHNYLRITRILKSLSEFGLERLNAPFLLFFLVEQGRGELDGRGLKRSLEGYWRWCIRDEEERKWVGERFDKVEAGEEEWSEEKYKVALERRKKTGSFVEREETVETL